MEQLYVYIDDVMEKLTPPPEKEAPEERRVIVIDMGNDPEEEAE